MRGLALTTSKSNEEFLKQPMSTPTALQPTFETVEVRTVPENPCLSTNYWDRRRHDTAIYDKVTKSLLAGELGAR